MDNYFQDARVASQAFLKTNRQIQKGVQAPDQRIQNLLEQLNKM